MRKGRLSVDEKVWWQTSGNEIVVIGRMEIAYR